MRFFSRSCAAAWDLVPGGVDSCMQLDNVFCVLFAAAQGLEMTSRSRSLAHNRDQRAQMAVPAVEAARGNPALNIYKSRAGRGETRGRDRSTGRRVEPAGLRLPSKSWAARRARAVRRSGTQAQIGAAGAAEDRRRPNRDAAEEQKMFVYLRRRSPSPTV